LNPWAVRPPAFQAGTFRQRTHTLQRSAGEESRTLTEFPPKDFGSFMSAIPSHPQMVGGPPPGALDGEDFLSLPTPSGVSRHCVQNELLLAKTPVQPRSSARDGSRTRTPTGRGF
jgi:hypothetical protein